MSAVPTAIQLMSSDFLVGYIQAVDGEQDPRNLLTVFHSTYVILHHLQFGELLLLLSTLNSDVSS